MPTSQLWKDIKQKGECKMTTEKKITVVLYAIAAFLFYIAACDVEGFIELGAVKFILLYIVLLGGMALMVWLANPWRVRQLRRIFHLLLEVRH